MDKPKQSTQHTSALERVRNAAENKYVRVGSALSIGLGSLSLAGCAEPTPAAEPSPTSIAGEPTPEVTAEQGGLEFSGIPSVESLEISPELSPEEVGQRYNEITAGWVSAGANRENFELQVVGDNAYIPQDEFIQKIVDAAKPVFAEALYGEDWQNPIFSENIEALTYAHYGTLVAFFTTQSSSLPEPYSRSKELVAIENVSEEESSLSMTLLVDYFDNAEAVGYDSTVNGIKESIQVTFEEENGRLVLSQPFTAQTR